MNSKDESLGGTGARCTRRLPAGAQAIEAVGGLCIAQDSETAQVPSMPRHLLGAGYLIAAIASLV